MAYEKLTRYNQIGKIDWQKAKFIDFKVILSEDNGGWFLDRETQEQYFKVKFTFSDEEDNFIERTYDYSKAVAWYNDNSEPVTREQLCIENLKACGVKDGELKNVSDAIGNFVRLGGKIEQNGKYTNITLYINPPITFVEKDVSDLNTDELLAKFNAQSTVTTEPQKQETEVKEAEVVSDDDLDNVPF